MPDSDDLTPAESALLVVLLAESRDVSNRELKERYGFTLTGSSRVKLNRLTYVESWMEGRMFVHRLGEAGWARCYQQLNFESPRARALGAALSSLFGAVHRHLARTGLSLADAFGQPATAGPSASGAPAAADLGERLRAAYHALAPDPGGWVSLADLRSRLAGVSRAEVDAALRELERAPEVNIVPESNQKGLTDGDRAAAVRIGGQDKHFLTIGV